MKLKYYLSGLGVGIIISSLILMIINAITPIDDETVIKRAKELGYVESTDQQYFNQLKNSSGLSDNDKNTKNEEKETTISSQIDSDDADVEEPEDITYLIVEKYFVLSLTKDYKL